MNVFVIKIQILFGILAPVILGINCFIRNRVCLCYISFSFSSKASPGKKLGDECIPGMCSALNSNCKWNGSFFKCVCKDKFIAVNSTHCGHPMSNIEEQKCRDCLERDSLCLDFNNDGLTDECWCPKNETCSGNKSKESKYF